MAYPLSLNKKEIEDILPLTPLQDGMLFHYINEPESEMYFEQLSVMLEGNISLKKVKNAWEAVAKDNEVLRSIFRWEKLEKPLQIILKTPTIPVCYWEINEKNIKNRYHALEQRKQEDRNQGIDIRIEPFRIILCKIEENKYNMIISNHHILYDGWSNGILLKEFLEAYLCLEHNHEIPRRHKNKLSEYVKWRTLQDQQPLREYWTSAMEGYEAKNISFFQNKKMAEQATGATEKISITINPEVKNKIENLAKINNTTVSVIFYAAWGLLLKKYYNSKDIAFGITVSGRSIPVKGIEDMCGLFINTIPLRMKLNQTENIKDVINHTDRVLAASRDFESASLVDIHSWSKYRNTQTLFDTLMVIENYPLDSQLKKNGVLNVLGYSFYEATNFGLNVEVETFGDFIVNFIYHTNKYSKPIIKRITEQFENILFQISNNSDLKLEDVDLLTKKDKKQLLFDFNKTQEIYEEDQTINSLFERQVAKGSNSLALLFKDNQISYEQLNKKSNALAMLLKEMGVSKDVIVGILSDRSIEMICAMLAVLKAGGAYLPLDSAYPTNRIEYILEDSKAALLLTNINNYGNLQFLGTVIDIADSRIYARECVNPPSVSDADDLAYVIYTSGSTGNPKGVMISHKAVNNFIHGVSRVIPFSDESRILALTTMSFDIFVLETLLPLLLGGVVILADEVEQTDPEALHNIIINSSVNMLQLTPSRLQMILYDNKWNSCLSSVATIMVGGEALPSPLFQNLKRIYTGKIYNMYGPTETTVWSTIKDLTYEDEITVGKPIANTRIYIIGEDTELVPIGIPGELCIAGDGLARGYWNRPELTLEKFIPNPFESGQKLYKTGDLARWLPDGNLDLLGRIDNQVKIRGYRIELGEIDDCLLALPSVKEAASTVFSDQMGNKYICGYYVGENEFRISDIRDLLVQSLPEYMIPSFIIRLDKMPITPNQKIDRKQLPQPQVDAFEPDKQSPIATMTELKLEKIWSQILKIERIGTEINFFEIGGHSLKATLLVSKISKEFDVSFPVKAVFSNPTIRSQAAYINSVSKDNYEKITKADIQEYFPVSSGQLRMYLIWQFEPQSTAYNMSGAIEIEGSIELEKLKDAYQALIKRHEILRTSFHLIDGEPKQKIHDSIPWKLAYQEEKDKNIEDLMAEFVEPFDLSEVPLFRSRLVKTSETCYLLLFDIHHIITDGISMNVLIRDLTQMYQGKMLLPLELGYTDYAVWQNGLSKQAGYQSHEKFWLENLSGVIPVLELPTDFVRPMQQSFEGAVVRNSVDRDLTLGIMDYVHKTGSTLYIVMLAALNVLLHKYTGQEDILIGTPVSGRRKAELEEMAGMFVNTIVMRNYPAKEKKFSDFIDEVRNNSLQALDHQEYSFEELVEKLDLVRDLSRSPLFDVMLSMQNMDIEPICFDGVEFKPCKTDNFISKFDLTLTVVEEDGKIQLTMEYCTRIFSRLRIENMLSHFVHILERIIEKPEICIGKLSPLSDVEQGSILSLCNQTTAFYPQNQTITQLFEEKAKVYSERPALVCLSDQAVTISYQLLNQKANWLAHTLRGKGVTPGNIVAIIADRSAEMMIGIMAILKAGGAYLPVDPRNPVDRIEFMLQDSKASMTLTTSDFKDLVSAFHCQIIFLDNESSYTGDGENLKCLNQADDLAYVIYTSGSTGVPKGVMISHKSMVNLLWSMQRRYPLLEDGAYLLKTTYTFDVSVSEIFGWFLEGGKLVLLEREAHKDPYEILQAIEKNRITHINFVPSMFHVFLDILSKENQGQLSTLKYVFVAGESISADDVNRFRRIAPEVGFKNLYGPTEATVYATAYDLEEFKQGFQVPIGKPIDNYKIYIINNQNQLQPIGVPGELCIAGVGLATGYLNRPELTKEKFIESPFAVGELLYKTGDLAKLLPDGNIEYCGRLDDQVKIRGFRIELGEIESLLRQYPGVSDVVVASMEDAAGDKILCGYYMCDREILAAQFNEYLSSSLPEYMIPSRYLKLSNMPLNKNGKVDRKALPKLDERILAQNEFIAPEGLIEQALANIWEDVLKVDRVGREDNFFSLGGHSLKTVQLAGKIRKELNVDIKLFDLFKLYTLRKQAKHIELLGKSSFYSIQPASDMPHYPLTYAQSRMYTLWEYDRLSTAYNIAAPILIEGKIDKNVLEQAFGEVILKHEILRTCFRIVGGEPRAFINQPGDFRIQYIEKELEENFDLDELRKEFVRPFNLQNEILFRVSFFNIDQNKMLLLVDMHHIIGDGVSIEILVKEIVQYLSGMKTDIPKIQYKDIAVWKKQDTGKQYLDKQAGYWRKELEQEFTRLNLITDFHRTQMPSFEGDRISFEINSVLLEKLKKVGNDYSVTLNSVLMSIFYVLLHKYTGQQDIIIGIPVSGRKHVDTNKLIGMFVNTLPIRNQISSTSRFSDFIEDVNNKVVDALENQEYPLEVLLEDLNLAANMGENRLFNCVFSMQRVEEIQLKIEGTKVIPLDFNTKTAKFEITLIAVEKEHSINFIFEYASDLFTNETIRQMAGHYKNLLEQAAEAPMQQLSTMELLDLKGKSRILQQFNKTKVEYPQKKCIQELIEKQSENMPDKAAVAYGKNGKADQVLKYGELNQLANSLARYLRVKGIRRESIVAIMTDAVPQMLIGLVGILKSGAAFLPIDPSYPKERIQYMLEDSGAKILLTQKYLFEESDFSGETIWLDEESLYSCDSSNIEPVNAPEDLAYVIYTSGSTGRPKGVMVEHRSLVNLCWWHGEYYGLTESDRSLKYAGFGFDASVWEVFPYLIKGGCIYLVEDELRLDMKRLKTYIKENKISIAFLPTQICEQMMGENLPDLRKLLTGGDKLRSYRASSFEIYNNYGPTESTVVTTSFLVDKSYSNIPIGKPIYNTRIYILDGELNLQPVGIVGEIYISGDGVARGYLNMPELTAERFLENPYEDQSLMYRTGDFGRWLLDGTIEYLDRVDNQIKIRGYRIELGEIEHAICEIHEVREAVVTALEDEGETNLCAYIIHENKISPSEIRAYLLRCLPQYMVPAYFVQVNSIPLNANGKIDLKALPKPEKSHAESMEKEEPSTETEVRLVILWKEVLGVKELGITDDFFALGGYSLKAAVLSSRISEDFNIEMPIKQIFIAQNIKNLAKYIEGANKVLFSPLIKVEEQQFYPLSAAQRRIFILNKLNPEDISYNMPGAFFVEGEINIGKLKMVFERIFERHEILRTAFYLQNGQPVQKVYRDAEFEIEFISTTEDKVTEELRNFVRPFDLGRRTLMRFGLLSLNEVSSIFMFDMHHIISDGISMAIMLNDFCSIYNGIRLEPLTIQYKDYAAWHNQILGSPKIKRQEQYWMEVLENCVETRLPHKTLKTPDGNLGELIHNTILGDMYEKIDLLCKEMEVPKSVFMMTAFNLAIINEIGDTKAVTIGLPVSGRSNYQLGNLIGVFLNVLLITTKVDRNKNFIAYMRQVNDTVANALDNQDYPYDELYQRAKNLNEHTGGELFTIMFNYLSNEESQELSMEGLKITPMDVLSLQSKYEVTLYVKNQKECLQLDLVYRRGLFEDSMMQRIMNTILEIIRKVLEDKHMALIEMIKVQKEEINDPIADFDEFFDNSDFLIEERCEIN